MNKLLLLTSVSNFALLVSVQKLYAQTAFKSGLYSSFQGVKVTAEPLQKSSPVYAFKKKESLKEINKESDLDQKVPIPYTREQLLKKYPSIAFDQSPSNQLMTPDYQEDRFENDKISTKLLATHTELNIADSTKKAVATLQNITFSGANTFLKIHVRNNTPNDFLTGTMIVYWQKSDNTTKELWASYISAFPIILSQKGISFVYAFHTVNTANNDKFIFEVKDRKNKIRLQISFSGQLYNDKMSLLESEKIGTSKRKRKKERSKV